MVGVQGKGISIFWNTFFGKGKAETKVAVVHSRLITIRRGANHTPARTSVSRYSETGDTHRERVGGTIGPSSAGCAAHLHVRIHFKKEQKEEQHTNYAALPVRRRLQSPMLSVNISARQQCARSPSERDRDKE